jgi:VIT1/CCC1 family predicted Fe2+/Mn2+ transporter
MKTRWFPNSTYFRNFIFGVEDSLVSTVGLVAGVAAAGVAQATILTTGAILIFVEAFSMGVGSFLSETSAQEYKNESGGKPKSARAAGIMFVSYFVAGFIPLGPYVFMGATGAFWTSITLSIVALFFLGVASGRVSGSSLFKTGFRMALLGGLAIIIGVAVGAAFKVVV